MHIAERRLASEDVTTQMIARRLFVLLKFASAGRDFDQVREAPDEVEQTQQKRKTMVTQQGSVSLAHVEKGQPACAGIHLKRVGNVHRASEFMRRLRQTNLRSPFLRGCYEQFESSGRREAQ